MSVASLESWSRPTTVVGMHAGKSSGRVPSEKCPEPHSFCEQRRVKIEHGSNARTAPMDWGLRSRKFLGAMLQSCLGRCGRGDVVARLEEVNNLVVSPSSSNHFLRELGQRKDVSGKRPECLEMK